MLNIIPGELQLLNLGTYLIQFLPLLDDLNGLRKETPLSREQELLTVSLEIIIQERLG